ncbi:MAG: glycosyltransferase family 2 protein [Coriobacteriia bacterium]|nr:glycosyltransferase family 2 protein [Coriobacteriia bacterium]
MIKPDCTVKKEILSQKEFLFSVVVPVFNTERYVAEAIESVIGQDIGFERNVQLILVNDGSTDGSARICREYADRYPGNIVLIDKENGGVGSARNEGLKYVRGRYVNFLDSDDTWESDAFARVQAFFEENPRVRIAACRIAQFGKWNGFHALDYKFKKTKVVNIFKDWRFPQLSMASTFMRSDLLYPGVFSSLKWSEDFAVIVPLIAREGVYGVIREAQYNARRRDDDSSATESSTQDPDYYRDPLIRAYEHVFEESRKLFGYVPRFTQFAVMYDIQWRLKARQPLGILGPADLEWYEAEIRHLLSFVKDQVIWAQKHLTAHFKLYVMGFKRGISYEEAQQLLIPKGKNRYTLGESSFVRPKRERLISLDLIEPVNGALRFRGRLLKTVAPFGQMSLVAKLGGKEYPATFFYRKDISQGGFWGDDLCAVTGFEVLVPANKKGLLSFELDLFGSKKKAELQYGEFAGLSALLSANVWTRAGSTLLCTRKGDRILVLPDPTNTELALKELS